ncbi:tetratricopeptide repeat protein [Corallococcus carmarthensis]|uniref:tetratricopeptide repeat protein n=1 Tax=Corallococcus carmarthensis TaxID=2316728 RepID=UPI00148C1F54|nr:tetratricopeptide repeat protein [Corallococcus carmarthensis]NOK15856.1 tetratricopeptide repeat protein [Corallococcus carmarthensis]
MDSMCAVMACVAVLLLAGCAHEPESFKCEYVSDYNPRCVQELLNGNLDKAEVYCDLGLEFTPRSADLWANKGLIALSRGDPVKAKAHLLQALRYNPEHPRAYFHLGVLAMREGDYPQAETAFLQCVRLEPANVECQEHLEQARRASSP